MSTVATFGELMLRLTPPGHLRIAQTPSFEIHFGGAEANVAVTIAQLGGNAEFITKLPDHDIAQRAIDELRRLRVGTRGIQRGGDRLGVYFLEQGASQRPGKVIYDRAHSAIASAGPDDFRWPSLLGDAAWFHWSGITPALSRSASLHTERACKLARQRGLTISFDLNYRAKLWTKTRAGTVLRPLMRYVDLCCIGADEARTILRAKGDTDDAIAADLTRQYGFKTVAMTQRRSDTASATSWAAMLYTGGKSYTSPRHEISIVDRVGAGDSFTGALIFSLQRGDAPQRAIDFAVAASALKHTISGDYFLATLAEVEALAAGGHGGRVQR